MINLANAVRDQDYCLISEFMQAEFKVSLNADDIRLILDIHYPINTEPDDYRFRDWTNGTWAIFFRNRLNQHGLLILEANKKPRDIRVACELSIGFVEIVETEEMKQRLRNEAIIEDQATPRTKLTASNPQIVNPVDRIARRVTKARCETHDDK
jgi:hypothetical protein